MTENEAIKVLNGQMESCKDLGFVRWGNACEIAIQALEKQVPKKPYRIVSALVSLPF